MTVADGTRLLANNLAQGIKHSPALKNVLAKQRLEKAQRLPSQTELVQLYSIASYYSLGLHEGHATYTYTRGFINTIIKLIPLEEMDRGATWSAETNDLFHPIDTARNKALLPRFGNDGKISSQYSDSLGESHTLYWQNLMRQTFVQLFLAGKITFVNGVPQLQGAPKFSVKIAEGQRDYTIDFNNPSAAGALLSEGQIFLQWLNRNLEDRAGIAPRGLTSANVQAILNDAALRLDSLKASK